MTSQILTRLLASMFSRNGDNSSVAEAAPVAAPTVSATTPTRLPQESGGRHTLHIKRVKRTGTYTIIHTKPNGQREVWRRDIPTLEDARLRCLYVEELLGYEARL